MSSISERLYTAAGVRDLDAFAIKQGNAPGRDDFGYELMRRAGMATFEAAHGRFPSCNAWVIFCGAGNNAGDGYVIAREAYHFGVEVTLIALQDPQALRGDAARAAEDWIKAGGEIHRWPCEIPQHVNLVIDALLGTGLDRHLEGDYASAVEAINAIDHPRVAVDIPSGLSADGGTVMGKAVNADLTVTFIGLKRGLFTADGPDQAGDLHFVRLDVPTSVYASVEEFGFLLSEATLRRHLKPRRRNSHKGRFGHVAMVAGNTGMSGAARLASEASLRSGAGLCTLLTHPDHALVVNLSCPELMVHAVDNADQLAKLSSRASVLAVGPGLGQDAWGERLFHACLGDPRPLVVDADGLNFLAARPHQRNDWVLTPHPSEAARLLQCSTEQVQQDRVSAALEIADRYSACVVLKGAGTVIAGDKGAWAICALGNPGMATAGSGDVLTGVVAGMLAQGLSTWDAACVAVTAHAAAGDLAASAGQRGLLASDISRSLRQVINP